MRSKEQRKFISLCEEYGGSLHKRGKDKYEFKCCCPIHDERTPSFNFNKSTLFFHCFGCGSAGRGVTALEEEINNKIKLYE